MNRKESIDSSSKNYGLSFYDKLHDSKIFNKNEWDQGLYSQWIKPETRFASPQQLNNDKFTFKGIFIWIIFRLYRSGARWNEIEQE